MSTTHNKGKTGRGLLLIAATLSFIAAFLHIAVIIGGGDWYRVFGAGEHMAQLAESGSLYPVGVTLLIASVLFVWGLYALSGAGVIGRLPWLKQGLIAITAVYLLRAIAGFTLPFVSLHPSVIQNSLTFWLVSSLVCLVYGLCYLFGSLKHWQHLGRVDPL
ncbi:hypothetical protein [Lacimicrobium sp. SS2-24]|uniref:hypothetical protein n=1 Tax=Lacimicrobium sp. SS2-24 TaxID=2005569 RepID=UPI000B4B6115|nr:hypothetical protein [Lacimicrobium sp. SS2-24]